jgi:hypothetical protein
MENLGSAERDAEHRLFGNPDGYARDELERFCKACNPSAATSEHNAVLRKIAD